VRRQMVIGVDPDDELSDLMQLAHGRP